MSEWAGITDLLAQTVPRREMTQADTWLTSDPCPRGHAQKILGGLRLGDPRDARAFAAKVRAVAVSQGGSCGSCGASLEKGRPLEAFAATWLPGIRRDLLLRVHGEEPPRFALHAPGGATEDVSPDDARLAEVHAAAVVRAIAAGPGAIPDAPTGQVAERALTAVLRERPEYPPALVVLGRLRKAAGDRAGALALFERAIRADAESADAWFGVGDVLDEVGQNDKAFGAYMRAVALDAGHVDALNQGGVVAKRLGRLEDAKKLYGAALAREPHNAPTLYNLALLFHAQEERNGVVNALGMIRPAEMSPQIREAAFVMLAEVGGSFAQANAWGAARRALELASVLKPDDARIWFNRAAALTNLGALDDARAKARRAAQLDPAYELPRKLLADLEGKRAGRRLMGARVPYALRYVDSRGREATVMDFLVKVDDSEALRESEVARLSLSRDKDLYKLLVAKGHNARLAAPAEAKPKGLLGGLLGRKAPEPPAAQEARPFVFVLQQEPEPDFVRLAHAQRWVTAQGAEIASAPVDLVLLEGDAERPIPRVAEDAPFRLTRTLPPAIEGKPERFFPAGFAEYD